MTKQAIKQATKQAAKQAGKKAAKKKSAPAAKKSARKKTAKAQTDSRRVFLAVVDDSDELHQALYYACRRALRLGGRIALVYCIPPAEFQHFAGVGEVMREEGRKQGELMLKVNSEWVHKLTGEAPVTHLREGDPKVEVIKLIEEERDISILILGASTKGDNTDSLVEYLTNKGVSQCPVPVTIVPGHLSDKEIERLT